MKVSSKASKKKIIVYIIIIIVMISGNIYIYIRNSKPVELDIGSEALFNKIDKIKVKPTAEQKNIKQSVLGHNLFVALKKIGNWPVTPTNVGKADPFAPLINPSDLPSQSN